LSKVLDTDRFITMIAMEILLCHWDGYAMNRNNYRVFSDKESGKMVFMPHGMDQMFGIGGMGSPHTAIFPQMNGMVARTVVGTSEGRSRYRMKLAELRTNILDVAAITNRVQEIAAKIRPVLAELRPGSVNRHQSMVNAFCRNVAIRAQNLDEQLGTPPRDMKFAKNGIAHVDGWRPRMTASEARFETLAGPDGSSLLYVRADPNRSSVSWRTRAMLPQGSYRFEGRLRTKGVANTPGMGATLRISGARDSAPVKAEADWTRCTYEFEVQEPVADIELICELRGGTGAAWFDAGSLQLVQVQ
jgi:hypothetical protein